MAINVNAKFLSDGGICSIVVNGVELAIAANGGNGEMRQSLHTVIPPNSTYRVNQTAMDAVGVFELRVP
jgi:hypothetical protein